MFAFLVGLERETSGSVSDFLYRGQFVRFSVEPETRDKMKGLLFVLLATAMIATISAGPVHKVCFCG